MPKTPCHDRLLLAKHHFEDALHAARKGDGKKAREFSKDAMMYLAQSVKACGRIR